MHGSTCTLHARSCQQLQSLQSNQSKILTCNCCCWTNPAIGQKAPGEVEITTTVMPAPTRPAARRGCLLWIIATKKPHAYAAAATVAVLLLLVWVTSSTWTNDVAESSRPATMVVPQHAVPSSSRSTPSETPPKSTSTPSTQGVPAGSIVWSGSLSIREECGDDKVSKPFSVRLDTADKETCNSIDYTTAAIDTVPSHASSSSPPPTSASGSHPPSFPTVRSSARPPHELAPSRPVQHHHPQLDHALAWPT